MQFLTSKIFQKQKSQEKYLTHPQGKNLKILYLNFIQLFNIIKNDFVSSHLFEMLNFVLQH